LNKSFINFLKRNLAAVQLAVRSQLEYRINFLIDAVIQPLITACVETTIWFAIIGSLETKTLGGFGRESYLAYAFWANFVGRVTINWMYEFIMLDEIDSGRVNSILVRPISFYEFYLSQFVGYKMLTALTSFFVPVVGCYLLGVTIDYSKIPMIFLLILVYLIFVHTLSFAVACVAFFLNKAQSLTGIKNMIIWVMSGEMIPLDLYPEPLKSILIHSPFSSGVYIPVGFVTGRVSSELFWQSFISVFVGILLAGIFAKFMWTKGLKSYSGTGA
jgi:ABC-2 type transport system permease protein